MLGFLLFFNRLSLFFFFLHLLWLQLIVIVLLTLLLASMLGLLLHLFVRLYTVVAWV